MLYQLVACRPSCGARADPELSHGALCYGQLLLSRYLYVRMSAERAFQQTQSTRPSMPRASMVEKATTHLASSRKQTLSQMPQLHSIKLFKTIADPHIANNKKVCCYRIYVAGCLPEVPSWADAWEAILTALFLAKDSDRLSRCSFNLDTISLWYS